MRLFLSAFLLSFMTYLTARFAAALAKLQNG